MRTRAVGSVFVAALVLGAVACTERHVGTGPTTFGVSTVTPNRGSTFEPTHVRIAGTGFTPGARLAIDGVEVQAVVASAFAITAALPAHAPGRVEVVVTNGGGETASAPDGFTYVAPSPITIASFDPDTVLVTGEQFAIHGSGFLSGVVVTIDGARVTALLVDNAKLIVNAPAHSAGSVNVFVTNPFTEPLLLSGALTYRPLPPMQIERVQPAIGSTAGGTLLVLSGRSFQAGASVSIDGQLAAAELGDFGFLYADAPAHAPGPVDIAVTNPDGQTHRLTAGFTYAPPQAFNFSGRWDAYVRPAWSGGPGFRVENDTVTGLWCGSEVVNLVPTPLPPVTDGAFSFNAAGGGRISGHIVAAGEAAGTVSIPGCGSGNWYAYRR